MIDTEAIRVRIFWGRAVKPEQANTPAILDEFEQVLDAYDNLASELAAARDQIKRARDRVLNPRASEQAAIPMAVDVNAILRGPDADEDEDDA